MIVKVRFSEPPPADIRRQFDAKPDARVKVATTNALLPAYTQLFREDGSRLADEGEDLPKYPGRRGTITGPSPRPDGAPAGDAHWSMIAASEVLDDSIDPDFRAETEAAAIEHAHDYSQDSALDEEVDIDADLPDEERARDAEDGDDVVAVTPMFSDLPEGAAWTSH